MNKNNNKRRNSLAIYLLGALLLGLIGGGFSFFYFFNQNYNKYIFSQDIDLNSGNYNRANVVIQEAKKVSISQDLKIEENNNYFEETLVGIFKKKAGDDEHYFLNEVLFNGVIISSDGWIVVNIIGEKSLVWDDIKSKDNYIVISRKDKKVYKIEDSIYSKKDELLFLKIKDSNNFPVKSFLSFSDLKVGQSLLLADFLGRISPTTILSKQKDVQTILSDDFRNEIILNSDIGQEFKSSFLFDLNANLIGLVSADAHIYSFADLRPLVFNFFNTKKLDKAGLGLKYLDLSGVITLDDSIPSQGAWLYNNGLPAVEPRSSADQAGFKTGDIITRVNDYNLDENNNLFDVLNNFKTGDKLTFFIWRNDVQQEIKLELP